MFILRFFYAAVIIISGLTAVAGIFNSDLSKNTTGEYVTFGAGVFFFFITVSLIILGLKLFKEDIDD